MSVSPATFRPISLDRVDPRPPPRQVSFAPPEYPRPHLQSPGSYTSDMRAEGVDVSAPTLHDVLSRHSSAVVRQAGRLRATPAPWWRSDARRSSPPPLRSGPRASGDLRTWRHALVGPTDDLDQSRDTHAGPGASPV